MKKAAQFTQTDVSRALRATKAAGLQVTRVEIRSDGTISVVIAEGENLAIQPAGASFDKWKAGLNAR